MKASLFTVITHPHTKRKLHMYVCVCRPDIHYLMFASNHIVIEYCLKGTRLQMVYSCCRIQSLWMSYSPSKCHTV